MKCDGSFPLEKAGTIAAYGSGVRSTVKGGGGSGEVNTRYTVTVEAGLQQAGFRVISTKWLDDYEDMIRKKKKEYGKYLMEHANPDLSNPLFALLGEIMPEPDYELPLDFSADAAVYVLGRVSGEGADRRPMQGDLFLTETEVRDILALNARYKNFMLMINTGGPVDLSPVLEVRNILVLSQLGSETGTAAAEILLGKQNPSGKLTTTWSRWEDYCPDLEFGKKDDTHYCEGIYVGYRYFDSAGKKALFPFGYGTSYTSFEMSDEQLEAEGERIKISAKVKNTGFYPGKEVLQVYVSVPSGRLEQPYQSLAGFKKTKLLNPGQEELLEIIIPMSDLVSYDPEKECYLLEKGSYIFWIGNSSADTVAAGAVYLTEEAPVKKVHSVLPEKEIRKLYYKGETPKVPKNIKIFTISAADIPFKKVSYEWNEEIDPKVKNMTDQELILMSMGAFTPGAEGNVIGNAGIQVAGAAGETASLPGYPEIPKITMADGPAGLRLSKEFYRDENGVHSLGNGSLPEMTIELMTDEIVKAMSGESTAPEGCTVDYQYATAIPIGTAVAQSWNLELAEHYGDIVGTEMETFGIQLWLAPALNIHRSILCGRNFEYYSEDPLVSGKFAAAVTRGVQKHPGCGVVIKHFAANNQETNRMNNNSVVDERTLREIYLKGFGICIQEAAPAAVMTSYNLLNGTHTSELAGLTRDYLLGEENYQGIVMTDWIVSAAMPKNQKHRHPEAHRIAKAGGNLIMPGEQKDYDDMLKAVKNHSLSRKRLEANVSGLLKLIVQLNDEGKTNEKI